jgi:hypothetical protein
VEKPKPTQAPPSQDGDLMSQGDEFEFQGGAATNPEGEQGNESEKNRDHAHDGMAEMQKSLGFFGLSEF